MSAVERPPLIVHVVFSLGTGGLENGLVNIINRIPTDRYRHAIVCVKESGDFAERISIPGVEIIELHKREGIDLKLYCRLWRAVRDLRPAIVHTRNIGAIEAQFVSFLFPGVKGVHGEHGRDIYDVEGNNRKYRVLRKVLCPFIDGFIAVSQDLQNWLIESVGVPRHKVVQIYNGVDVARFSPENRACPPGMPSGFDDNAVIVGTVGRLAAIKDQTTLLRAISFLRREGGPASEKIRVLLVGDGPLRSQLESLVRELDLQDVCWMAGNRGDIPDLLGIIDIFVLPSLGEGVSNTILEAMACGLPIIASRVGGNPELVKHEVNGLLFTVGDASALADAISRLIDDDVLRKQMGRMSRCKAMKNFDWTRTVERYCSVYDQLLAGQRNIGVT